MKPLPDHGFDDEEEPTKEDIGAQRPLRPVRREISDVVEKIDLRRPATGARVAEHSVWGADAWLGAIDVLRAWRKRKGPRSVLISIRYEDARVVERTINLDKPERWRK